MNDREYDKILSSYIGIGKEISDNKDIEKEPN